VYDLLIKEKLLPCHVGVRLSHAMVDLHRTGGGAQSFLYIRAVQGSSKVSRV